MISHLLTSGATGSGALSGVDQRAISGVEHRGMASDQTADKTVSAERIVAEANTVALAKDRPPREHPEHGKAGATALALGALGVVYGDIGTSPLYSLKEAFTESRPASGGRDQHLRACVRWPSGRSSSSSRSST